MLILALDSSAVTATAALLEDNKIIGEYSINNRLTHSEKLLPMIDSLLRLSGYEIDDISLIAAAAGPGSFTGVRIGVATAKGLAFAKNISCACVSVLEALAENMRLCDEALNASFSDFVICPCMDARRDELYNALFISKNGDIERLCQDRAISCEALLGELEKMSMPIFLCGDGAQKMFEYLKDIKTELDVRLATRLLQNASSVGRVGYRLSKRGELCDLHSLRPIYLRDSQAERKLKEK